MEIRGNNSSVRFFFILLAMAARVRTSRKLSALRSPPYCLPCFLFVGLLCVVGGDFIYDDFESTIGIDFNGAASTSSCDEGKRLAYQTQHGSADQNIEIPPSTSEEDTNQAKFQEVVMDDKTVKTSTVAKETSILGHRETWGKSFYTGCRVRLRLTPSEPGKVGSVWHARPVAVYLGFETKFKFQIVDPSRTCTLVKDRQFSTQHHQSCMIHGGDGFAFVLHGNPDRTRTLGNPGMDMGYGGIVNSIAFEFDTWWNPVNGDLFDDHVSIQARGPKLGNHPGEIARLVIAKNISLADGKEHVAKIVYFPYINYDYAEYFTAVDNLREFILDNEENRRVGTLLLFLDDIPDNSTDLRAKPVLAIPINLSAVLELREGTAWAGFTASTGRQFQKHDIISWQFCEDYKQCGFNLKNTFDYHQTDMEYHHR